VSTWSIRQVVEWTAKDFAARGIESARLDAELLVSEAIGLDRVRLYMDLDRPLDEPERAAIRELVQRRRRREPVAYILGRREFWGRRFEVSPSVLVPRPDTETLVERALDLLEPGGEARVLDLCAGSGAIGITLAAERPGVTVELADLSAEALEVAARNAARLEVEVAIHRGDLFGPVQGRFDLIVCNPPYVTEAEMAELSPEVRDHEPRAALVSGATGFEIHDRLAAGAGEHLTEEGTLLVEVGAGQATELERRMRAQPWVRSTALHRDLAGIDRVVEASGRRAREPQPQAGLAEGEEPGEQEQPRSD